MSGQAVSASLAPESVASYALTELGSPAGAPQRFFRKVFPLQLTGTAFNLKIDPAGTNLQASFSPLSYNAKNHAAVPLRATLSNKDSTTLLVTLAAPRSIDTIRLAAPPSPAPQVQLFRVDGDAVSEKATKTFAHGSHLANGTFVDRRFAVRMLGTGGNIGLSPDGTSQVMIDSFPTGPRIGLAPASAPDTAIFFWQQPGEIQETASVTDGAKLAAALQSLLDSLPRPLPDPLEVALVVESDAECSFSLSALHVEARGVVETFASGEAKAALRFPGAGAQTQTAIFQLPRSASVTAATVNVIESFRTDRVANGDSEQPLSALPQHLGAFLSGEKYVAQRVTPAQATSVTGLALGLSALAGNTELRVELQEDWHDQPSGKVLASGKLALKRVGQPTWATVLFTDPVIIATQPHWLIVKAASGQAVWVAASASADVLILERADEAANWQQTSALKGLQTAYQLLTRAASLQQSQPPAIFMLGSQALTGTANPDGSKTFTLAAALNAYLSAQPSSPGTVNVPLALASALPGIATLTNLHVEFEL